MRSQEQILFEKIYSLIRNEYDIILRKIQIISNTPEDENIVKQFRIYHSDGYCFDVSKKIFTYDINVDYPYEYTFFSEWENFNDITVEDAISLINENL